MIAGGNRPSLTEARAETGGGFLGVGLSIQSNILLKTDFFDSLSSLHKSGLLFCDVDLAQCFCSCQTKHRTIYETVNTALGDGIHAYAIALF